MKTFWTVKEDDLDFSLSLGFVFESYKEAKDFSRKPKRSPPKKHSYSSIGKIKIMENEMRRQRENRPELFEKKEK